MSTGKKYTISFAGDTSLGEWYLRKPGKEKLVERLENNPLSFFAGVKPLVENSDYFILNLETVLEDSPKSVLEGKQYPNYDNPERTLSVLEDLGVSAVSLANNHTMDFGEKVLLKTLKRLEKAKIKSFGAGKNIKEASAPLKITLEGKKSNKNIYIFTGMRAGKRYRDYGFFADKKKPGVNNLPQKGLSKKISNLRKKEPDSIIIVCPHWQGLDYRWSSERKRIKERSMAFIDAGADYIFGHGPHMLNDIVNYNGGIIAYSIGNFVFNSSGRYKKMQAPPYSLIVNMEIQEEKDGSWDVKNKFYPIVTDNKATDFNVQMVGKLEHNHLIDLLQNRTNISLLANLDSKGRNYFTINSDKNTIEKKKNNTFGFNLKEFIMNNSILPKINFKNDKVFNHHIKQLGELHNELDKKFYSYYETLARSKDITQNKDRLNQLSKIVKKEYLSHKFLKRFERKKILFNKAISFREIMVEKSQLSRLGHRDYAWELDKKIRAYPFADSIGLRRPQSDPNIYKFSEIKEPDHPVVIKPIQATGSMGVYLVFNKNTIFSAREGKYLNSWEELQEDANKKLDNWKAGKNNLITKDEWMIEELILSELNSTIPPSDLKFYCFYGEVVLVLETNRSHQKYCFWDAEMNLVDTGKYNDDFKGSGFTKEDLDIVSSASLNIPAPYIRLDMLKGHDGLVFGEATPRPGQFHLFNDEYDRKLGEAFRRAEERIKSDLLNGKKFDSFTNHFDV